MTERLYIANFSPHEVAFRFYGYGTTIHRVIAVGGQIVITAPRRVLDAIVAHHARYGLVAASEVRPGTKFGGLAYRFGEPVNMVAIESPVDRAVFPLLPITDGRGMGKELAA